MNPAWWLTLLLFAPCLGACVVLALPSDRPGLLRVVALAFLMLSLLLTLGMLVPGVGPDVLPGIPQVQAVVSQPWIPSFGADYFLGLDGLNTPMLVMVAILSALALLASWSINKSPKAYLALLLVLATGMLGVFLALDLLLFYVFFEVVLLPMYFLVGFWGGERKEYAAIKFFLYTLFGSVLILVAVLMLFFASDLTQLSADALARAEVSAESLQQIAQAQQAGQPLHTFNLLALRELAAQTEVFQRPILLGRSTQWWAFLLLLIGFLIKVPAVPLHTWLPDAHVEAPTPVSMLLAGVLLKLGGYGLIRVAYPLCPEAGEQFAPLVVTLGAISILYGAFAALAQTDFKRLVAYSSISHMGYVILGVALWSLGNNRATGFDAQAWSLAANGAVFQMVAHGITSAGMFFLVGCLYDRLGHRDLNRCGGLFSKMPVYAGVSVVIFFAALGLPGLCGFIGEVFVLLGSWPFAPAAAAVGAFTLIITAGYFLGALQRVFLGQEYAGPHAERLVDLNLRERLVIGPLVAAAVALGVFPDLAFRYIEPTVSRRFSQQEFQQQEFQQASSQEPGVVSLVQETPVANSGGLR